MEVFEARLCHYDYILGSGYGFNHPPNSNSQAQLGVLLGYLSIL